MSGALWDVLDAVPLPVRPSAGMRTAGAVLGLRARRREGRPVDLARERRHNDWLTHRLRAPGGVSETAEDVEGVRVVTLSSQGPSRGVVLFLHGGAYVMGSARQVLTSADLARDGGPAVMSVEYRLAPEHPHPAAVDDAVAVYRHLVTSGPPDQVVVVGESAGGGLAMLMLQRARDEGLPMPRLAVTAFPWVDLTMAGASATTNRGKDLLTRSELDHEAALFAPGRDLDDPEVSPLFGSFRDMPPTYVAVGTRDLLLDDARRLAAALRSDGADVRLEEWPGAIHGFTALPLREGHLYRRRLRHLVDAALSSPLASPAPDGVPDLHTHTGTSSTDEL